MNIKEDENSTYYMKRERKTDRKKNRNTVYRHMFEKKTKKKHNVKRKIK